MIASCKNAVLQKMLGACSLLASAWRSREGKLEDKHARALVYTCCATFRGAPEEYGVMAKFAALVRVVQDPAWGVCWVCKNRLYIVMLSLCPLCSFTTNQSGRSSIAFACHLMRSSAADWRSLVDPCGRDTEGSYRGVSSPIKSVSALPLYSPGDDPEVLKVSRFVHPFAVGQGNHSRLRCRRHSRRGELPEQPRAVDVARGQLVVRLDAEDVPNLCTHQGKKRRRAMNVRLVARGSRKNAHHVSS